MLDFYGIELCDEQTGKVKRASNWEERFDNLNSWAWNFKPTIYSLYYSLDVTEDTNPFFLFTFLIFGSRTHNNLRLTRILKCLGTLGYPNYQAPLVRFFLEMTLERGLLPNVKTSVLNYFVFAVRDKRQRRRLIKFAYSKYHNKEEFVWCPKNIQRKLSRLIARASQNHEESTAF